MTADFSTRLARARFRAWHRGTREADFMIGGFFDRYHAGWDEAALAWFEALLEDDDVDVMAWALGTQASPAHLAGAMFNVLAGVNTIHVPYKGAGVATTDVLSGQKYPYQVRVSIKRGVDSEFREYEGCGKMLK